VRRRLFGYGGGREATSVRRMLDLQTIYVVNISMAFVMSAISLYYWYQHPDVRGLRGWAIGLFVGGLGAIVLSQRTPATSIVFGVTGGVLVIAGVCLLWAAVRRFNGGTMKISQSAAPVALFLLFEAILQGAGASDRARIVVAPLIVAVLAASIAREVITGAGSEGYGARLPTAIAFAGLTVAMMLRTIIVLFGDMSAANPLQDDMRAITQLLSTISLIAAMCGFLIMINELLRSRILTLVAYDELTGMLNRRGFLHRAQQLCQSARATRTPVSVLMMDLDHFSAVNGAIGHEGGDRALVAFAEVASGQMRSGDVIGRLGGEEFCALLLGATEVEGRQIAERIRARVAAMSLQVDHKPLQLTVSIGVAPLRQEDLRTAMRLADIALYSAKGLGRNRVCDAPQPPHAPTALWSSA
jgi:diguanylate cyclase (GGDEF)-like protein